MMIVKPEHWIEKPDENGNGFLCAQVVSGEIEYPLPIETHRVALEDVTLEKKQEFSFIFECAEKPHVYPDEKAYYDKHDFSFASESVIPAGLFSPRNDKDFIPSPRIILTGKVIKSYDDATEFGFDKDEKLFTLSCLGNEYDAVLHAELAGNGSIEEGNIVSCVYWVQGWPRGN